MQLTYLFNTDYKEIHKANSFKDSGNYAGFIKSLREIGFTDAEITLLTGISIPEVDKAKEKENAIKMRQMLDGLLKGNSPNSSKSTTKSLSGYVSEDQENLNRKFQQIRKNRNPLETTTDAPLTIFERARQLRNK